MKRVYFIIEKMLEKIAELEKEGIERDYPLNWERMHMISCARMGQILAEKRNVDPELAAIACAVHDYGRLVTGVQKDHAVSGYEPLKKFLKETGKFTEDEIEELAVSARNHSNKGEIGGSLEELVKDADVLDYYLYGVPLEREEQKKRLEVVVKEI